MCTAMRKNVVFLAMSVALLTACSNDVALDSGTQSAESVNNAISFQMINRNSITSRAEGTALNSAGHYNFGVFAYKSASSTGLNAGTEDLQVMNNYLVGYGPQSSETSKGYQMSTDNQTTYGESGTSTSTSLWAYEKLGYEEYTYSGSDGYYTKTDAHNGFYESNNKNQYLKYWDKSYDQTDFFAYAPYLNGTTTASVKTDNGSTLISVPMTDGYDDASKYDFLAAHKTVVKNDYGSKVAIDFKRLSAKMKIGFYEDIPGYWVEIIDLVSSEDSNPGVGVSAVPAKYAGQKYSYGTLYYEGTGTGTYATSGNSFTTTVAGTSEKVYASNSEPGKKYINFVIPEGDTSENTTTSHKIGENSTDASKSATEYYLIPDNGTNKSGLTFHVSYKLHSLDGKETITVYDATVYVPYQSNENTSTKYCDWQSNHVYTYIFKITKNSTGQTDKPDTIDPASPDASDKQALFPIIFDNCTVDAWTDNSSEHNIN